MPAGILLVVLAICSPPNQAASLADAVLDFRVVSETTIELVIDIDYRYSGNYGDVMIAVGSDLSSAVWISPDKIRRGMGKARVTLRNNNPSTSKQLIALMYGARAKPSDQFAYKIFPHTKHWNSPVSSPARGQAVQNTTADFFTASCNRLGARVSEETAPASCPAGTLVTGLRCSGRYCDNKDLYCCRYTAEQRFLEKSGWTYAISEERPNSSFF